VAPDRERAELYGLYIQTLKKTEKLLGTALISFYQDYKE
jgi:hypothetical protein